MKTFPSRLAVQGLLALSLAFACACTTTNLASGPSGVANDVSYAREASARLSAKTSLVSFPVTEGGRTWQTAGILRVPYSTNAAPRPAVVIVHGSGGVDSRGEHYAEALNRAGFVTLEIDLWAPRHVRTPADRPRAVSETLPDAFAALHFLIEQSQDVDAERIGVMGFSWGGVVSMLSATQPNRDRNATGGETFAAHAPLYPVCWVYNQAPGYDFTELTGAPVFIQAGTADTYDAPDRCIRLRQSLPPDAQARVRVQMYEGATHAWERREPDTTINDPYSHEGQGGAVELRYNEDATRSSTRAIVEFFESTLGEPERP
jgi:dienelactone hydrolase